MLLRLFLVIIILFSKMAIASSDHPTVVKFPSGTLTLSGELFMPEGKGPFPAVLYNHGSAPGMLNSQASAAIGPMFAKHGWVFFMPYRRGQGLSQGQGTYIMDQIKSARWSLFGSASKTMVKLLSTSQLDDQLAAFDWLKKQKFVQQNRIATMGNSFGGIEVILGMAHANYCAGVDASGGARSWAHSDELQRMMKDSAKQIHRPVFFFQAANDYDLSPGKVLSSEMQNAGKITLVKIYPNYGDTKKMGHSFPYRAVPIWFNDAFSFLNRYCSELKGT